MDATQQSNQGDKMSAHYNRIDAVSSEEDCIECHPTKECSNCFMEIENNENEFCVVCEISNIIKGE